MENDNYWNRITTRRLGRRRVIGSAGFAALGVAAAATVGCGDDDDEGSSGGTATSTATTGAGTGTATAAATPKKGGRMTVGNAAMLGQFDPNTSTSAVDWSLLFAIYDTLFVTDKAGTIQPKLATAWEPVGDGSLQIKLRQGVKFQDGTPFNAAAVKRNVERTIQLGAQSRIFSQWSQVDTVTAPDETTVVFKLKSPQYGPMVANMATIAGAMPSPDAVDKAGANFSTAPVGSGPYKVDSIALDSNIKTSANPTYWGAAEGIAPHLDGIDFKIVPDTAALVTAMQAGEIDVIHYSLFAPAAEIEQLKPVSGVKILQEPGHSFTEQRLNRGVAPFDNTDLLKAFGYALDRDAILKANHGGLGRPAGGPVNPATWAFDESFKGFNLPKAEREAKVKEHLQKGGAPGGFDVTLKFVTSAATQQRAEVIAQMVKPFNINVKLESLPTTAGTSYLYDGDFQANPSFTPQYSPDPDSIFRPNFHSKGQFNYHRYANAELDALLDKAAAETNQDSRKQMYFDAQKLIFESGIPRIPNVHVDILIPYKEKVKNLTVGWDTYIRVNNVWLDG